MLLQSAALEALLSEFGSQTKLDGFGRDIREVLIAAASPTGYLRLYSERNGLDLRFDGINYSRCIDRQTLEIDRQALIQEVKNRSNRPDISVETLLVGVEEIESRGDDPWQICTGTDLLGVLSIGLRHALGNSSATTVQDDRLRQALRLAYSNDDFAQTELKKRLQEWQTQNAPFKIIS